MDEFFSTLDNLYLTGDQEKIERFMLDKLRELEEQGETLDASSVMNELAGYYRGTSRYGDSVRYAQASMAILQERGMGETIQYATMLLNYAGVLRLMGKLTQSRDSFRESKAILERLGETGSYAYVSLLNNLALTLQDMNEGDEAIELAQQALSIMRGRAEREDEVPTSLNNLSAMYLRQKKFDKAEETVRQALEEFHALPERSAHEAAAWGTLGVIFYQTKRLPEALDAFEKAAEQTKFVFGENVDYASSLRSIAVIKLAMQDRKGAAERQAQALRVLKNLLGEQHPRVQSYAQELREYEEAQP